MKYYNSTVLLLANNCNIICGEDGVPIKVHDSTPPPIDTREFIKDIRLNLKVLNPTYDVEMIHNYLGSASYLSERDWRSDIDKTGRFVELLNMGYLPIFMCPSFAGSMDISLWERMIKALDLSVIKTPCYRADGSRVDCKLDDIFVSKIQIRKLLNIQYRDMNSQLVLAELLQKFMSIEGV